MKFFSVRTVAVLPVLLLAACNAQQGSVMDIDLPVDEHSSSSYDGPYLEIEEDETDDTVELNVRASSSSVAP